VVPKTARLGQTEMPRPRPRVDEHDQARTQAVPASLSAGIVRWPAAADRRDSRPLAADTPLLLMDEPFGRGRPRSTER